MLKIQKNNDDTFTIRPLSEECFTFSSEPEKYKITFIDTETTGITQSDQVIEVSTNTFSCDGKRLIKKIHSSQQFQQPTVPMHPDAIKKHGYSYEFLTGKKIDVKLLSSIINRSDYVIAHKAEFDYKMVNKTIKEPYDVKWACSIEMLDWSEYDSKSLSILGLYHGVYTRAHQALNDTELLAFVLNESGKIEELLRAADKNIIKLSAVNSPYKTKDVWKGFGFTFNGETKTWSKICYTEEESENIIRQTSHVYMLTRQDMTWNEYFSGN